MEKDHKIDSLETELRQWRRENEDLRLELENTQATHRMEMDKLELSQKKKLTDRNESLKLLKTKNTETLQAKSSLEGEICVFFFFFCCVFVSLFYLFFLCFDFVPQQKSKNFRQKWILSKKKEKSLMGS